MGVEETNREFNEWRQKIANNVCPRCNRRIKKEQSGYWVVARPCGHRLYQGRLASRHGNTT